MESYKLLKIALFKEAIFDNKYKIFIIIVNGGKKMCGICGFSGDSSSFIGKAGLIDMLKSIEHRGPDDEGMYYNQNVALGIRRLSIIDIENGQQPIHNETKDIQVKI